MKSFILIFLTVLFLLPSISTADRGGGLGFESGLFWSADLNRNECLDQDEAKAVFNLAEDEIFQRYDKDGNGCINRVEFSEFIQQSPWTKPFVPPGEDK